MQHKAKGPSEEEEPQELARFRREWLAELQKKKTDTSSSVLSGPPEPVTAKTGVLRIKPYGNLSPVSAAPQKYPGPSSQTISGHPSALSTVSSSSIERGPIPLPRTISSALNIGC